MRMRFIGWVMIPCLLGLAGCSDPGGTAPNLSSGGAVPLTTAGASGGAPEGAPASDMTRSAQEVQIAELTAMIAALGPDVSREEAARVARISVLEPLDWAQDWNAVDSALIHNIKVNNGSRPRGLCKDWADDLQARLARENFVTLDWHRAIANHDNLRIEHSTLIVSAKGAGMYDGVVLDPWRRGQGRLFFDLVREDHRYGWTPRQEVFALKRKWRAAREARQAAGRQ